MARPPSSSSRKSASKSDPETKPGLHPRNLHRAGYDFPALVKACPELAPFVTRSPRGDRTVDFGNPKAVKLLNRALLKQVYGVEGWDIPAGYLCPPIPGRVDYLHHLADLLAESHGGEIPRGAAIRVLDIGVGANCVYPLLGQRTYGWSFLGSDIDVGALESAARILKANPEMGRAIELRRQAVKGKIFEGLVKNGEAFEACMCNPPFHASLSAAREGSERKWRNLGRESSSGRPTLNFGGQGAELWCEGGEAAFVGRMIAESVRHPLLCRWFTALISKSSNLPAVQRALRSAEAREVRIIEMAQGQKKSRLVAWSFHPFPLERGE